MTRVALGSAAAVAGLRAGKDSRSSDLIVAVDGVPVTSSEALSREISARSVGEALATKINIRFERDTLERALESIAAEIDVREQARRIPALATETLHLGIELVDQRRHRQVGAVLARFAEGDRQVLAHPVDREAEVVFGGVHGLVAVLHLPGLRRAFGDDRDHRLDVEAGLLAEVDRFREALHQPGDADLVDHLGELARAGRLARARQHLPVSGSRHPATGRDRRAGAGRDRAAEAEGGGHGIGRALTEECIRRAERDDAPAIALHTSPIMEVALPMYLRMGFEFVRAVTPIHGVPYGVYRMHLRATGGDEGWDVA